MCDGFHDSVFKILIAIRGKSGVRDGMRSRHQNIAESSSDRRQKPFVVLVEGNIGSGKSTFMQYFRRYQNKIDFLPEPVGKWKNFEGFNLLQMIYQDPKRWSLSFQIYVLLTQLEDLAKTTNKPVKMIERSLYSARYCFVEYLRKMDLIHHIEYRILAKWFDTLPSVTEVDLSADLIIYLRTSPRVALERVRKRNREEERLISEDHIRRIHSLHENWLIRCQFPRHAPMIVIDADMDTEEMRLAFEKVARLFLGES